MEERLRNGSADHDLTKREIVFVSLCIILVSCKSNERFGSYMARRGIDDGRLALGERRKKEFAVLSIAGPLQRPSINPRGNL